MSSRIKAYPWSETKGLCKILRDPSIWSLSFPNLETRQIVKSAAKKAPTTRNLPQVKRIDVTDDETFGSAVIELLLSQAGRRELEKEFAKRFDNFRLRTFIARRLYDHYLSQYEGKIPEQDEICENRQTKGWQFVPANLLSWLARKERSPEDLQLLSLYACYFALRWPEQAEAIREVLVNRDEVFLNWLSDEEVAPENPPTQIPRPLPEPTQANAQVESQGIKSLAALPEAVLEGKQQLPQKTDLPPDSTELVRLLSSNSDWDRELSIDQLHSAIGLLTRKAERHADRLHEFDEIHRRVTSHLKDVAQIPWLESTLSLDRYLSLPQDISVEGALEHLASVEQEAARLLQVHTQLETLVSRLGSAPLPPVAYEVTSLEDITVHLEERVADLTERL